VHFYRLHDLRVKPRHQHWLATHHVLREKSIETNNRIAPDSFPSGQFCCIQIKKRSSTERMILFHLPAFYAA
jgi:hypothetical protein